MEKRIIKGLIAGAAGGMVASWAAQRFYDMARESSHSENMTPYLIGAGIGAAYVIMLQRRELPLIARVPLGAAIWLGEPEKTAAPVKGGRDIPEKARNLAMRMATKSLKKAAERALFA
jgi:uncharacterized membrane protein YeaQ/YmgE (transglycosylase-associated protein family)